MVIFYKSTNATKGGGVCCSRNKTTLQSCTYQREKKFNYRQVKEEIRTDLVFLRRPASQERENGHQFGNNRRNETRTSNRLATEDSRLTRLADYVLNRLINYIHFLRKQLGVNVGVWLWASAISTSLICIEYKNISHGERKTLT